MPHRKTCGALQASAVEAESRLRDQERRCAALEARIAQLETQPRALLGFPRKCSGCCVPLTAGDDARKALERLEAAPEAFRFRLRRRSSRSLRRRRRRIPLSAAPPSGPAAVSARRRLLRRRRILARTNCPASSRRPRLGWRSMRRRAIWYPGRCDFRPCRGLGAPSAEPVGISSAATAGRRGAEAVRRLETARSRLGRVEKAVRDLLQANLAEARRRERLRAAQTRLEASKAVNGLEELLGPLPDLGHPSRPSKPRNARKRLPQAVRPPPVVALLSKRTRVLLRFQDGSGTCSPWPNATARLSRSRPSPSFSRLLRRPRIARGAQRSDLVRTAVESGLGEVLEISPGRRPIRLRVPATGSPTSGRGWRSSLRHVAGTAYRTRISPENPCAAFARAFPDQLEKFRAAW